MKLKEWIESIKLALSFLTIIPFKSDYSPSILRKSLYFFSLSGIATGCIMFFAAKIASIFNPINFFLYASIILLAEYLTSNFFHIDGYCDCSDALYFTKQGKDKHKILKDPHIGMYAASLLFFLFIIKIGLMISVVQNNYLKLLLLYPVSGYIPAFIQTLFFKPMFEEGLGNSLKKEISFKHLSVSVIFSFVLSVFLFNLIFAAIYVISVFTISLIISFGLNKKFNGFNGDTIGFGIETAKLSGLAAGILLISKM